MRLSNALLRFYLVATAILVYLMVKFLLLAPESCAPEPVTEKEHIEFDFYELLKKNTPWWNEDGDRIETGS